MLRNLVSGYIGVGVGAAVATVVVLARDGKNSNAEIAYYAAVNSLVWPALIVFAVKQGREVTK